MRVRVLMGRSHFHGEEEEEGRQEGRQEEEGPRLRHATKRSARGFLTGRFVARVSVGDHGTHATGASPRGPADPHGSAALGLFPSRSTAAGFDRWPMRGRASAIRRERPARARGRPGRPDFLPASEVGQFLTDACRKLGAARAISPGRSLRASCPSFVRTWLRFALLASLASYAGSMARAARRDENRVRSGRWTRGRTTRHE